MAVPPICDFDWKAKDFDLPGVDGRRFSLADICGPKGVLIMFICNHCPYVKSVAPRIARDAAALREIGIGVAGINANDSEHYPADSFENMKRFAAEHDFGFPYLYDEPQDVARAYDAVCTPDFFGFNADLGLQYRGRLDESRTTAVEGAKRELYEAMCLVVETGRGPKEQLASMGCSIKWKAV
jgi:peroxiredoxin